jgi:hypothetical protein
VCSEIGQEAWKKGYKPVGCVDDRLIDTTQTDWERSRNIVRSLEVRDPSLLFSAVRPRWEVPESANMDYMSDAEDIVFITVARSCF